MYVELDNWSHTEVITKQQTQENSLTKNRLNKANASAPLNLDTHILNKWPVGKCFGVPMLDCRNVSHYKESFVHKKGFVNDVKGFVTKA